MPQSSVKINPTNCAIYAMKEFTKWIQNTWARSAENTTELIFDQTWGALPFISKSPIKKCLNLSGMVSPLYVIFKSRYDILIVCDMCWILSRMIIIDRRGIPKCCKVIWWLSGKWYNNIFLGHCKLGIKVVGYIVGNQIPIYGRFHDSRNCAVVWCIVLEKYFHDLWLLSLIFYQYICKYNSLQIQVRQWYEGPLHTMSMFFW